MDYGNDLEIVSTPQIRAYCKCGNRVTEVSNGWASKLVFCPSCESVYQLKLVKVPEAKYDEKFLNQCRKESSKHNSLEEK